MSTIETESRPVSQPTVSETPLPFAGVLADLRAACAAASGQAQRNLKADCRWARVDQARALAADPAAHARAVELARAGDEEAAEALRLATRLKPLPLPSPVRGNCGSVLGGAAVPPGLLEYLVAARRRGEGFDRAWGRALLELDALAGVWCEVLRATREAWRSAYLREPTPPGFHVERWDEAE